MTMLLDAGVPDSVGQVLTSSGHDVIHHRDVLPERTADIVVAQTALHAGAILVAIDNDMKQIAQKYGMTPHGDRFDRLSLIRLCCGEVISAKRVEQALSFIEHEWRFARQKRARRMWIDVGQHLLRTNR